jgi:hypothetical protein
VTIVDIKVDIPETVYTTYDITTMELLDQDKLPRIIVAPNGTVLRRDLDWEDLTPAEKAKS